MRSWVIFVVGAMAASACAQQPIGEVLGQDASVRGAVTVGSAGTTVMSGSHVTAGGSPAVIKLARGGELKVCPGSSISITASANARETLVGLSGGSIETRYRLSANADTVMTPDFRLLLAGPGDFHFAVGMKPNGDMCVKSLPGNSSAMIVHEVFGEGTHQVRPGDGLLFQKGRVQDAATLPPDGDCGCATTVKQAELGFPEQQSETAAAAIAKGQPAPTGEPLVGVTTKKDEVITKVDAPIVFRGEDLAGKETPRPTAPPAQPPTIQPQERGPEAQPSPKAEAQSPAPPPKPQKKRWYQKLGSAIANIFR